MGTFGEKERDLLITVAANVETICKNQNTYVTKGIWMWVTGGLAVLFMSLVIGAYTYTYEVSDDLSDHETNLTIHRMKR